MLLWFVVIAVLGPVGRGAPAGGVAWRSIRATPGRFLIAHRLHSFVVLGGVFLALTGGEALYADMGHFGRKLIRSSW